MTIVIFSCSQIYTSGHLLNVFFVSYFCLFSPETGPTQAGTKGEEGGKGKTWTRVVKKAKCLVAQTSQLLFWPFPYQKEKAVNDKKEDKKTKKAKENAEAEANEENHSENGDAKTNEVSGRTGKRLPLRKGRWWWRKGLTFAFLSDPAGGGSPRGGQGGGQVRVAPLPKLPPPLQPPPLKPSLFPPPTSQPALPTPSLSHGFPPRRIVNRGIFLSMIL